MNRAGTLTAGACLGIPNSTETLISCVASTSPTAGLVVAGDGDFGANGLFGMGGASRVFLFPLGEGIGGGGGVVDSMVSGGGHK